MQAILDTKYLMMIEYSNELENEKITIVNFSPSFDHFVESS